MLKNYFNITLRNLAKQKVYAFINIFSLAIGIAFCALIFLYVRDELTYDHFHEQADRIYRVSDVRFSADGGVESAHPYHPMPLAAALMEEIPEIQQAVRLSEESAFVRSGESALEENILFADPAILEVFSFPLRYGSTETALSDLNAIVLSRQAATRYFGESNPVGQTLDLRLDTAFEEFTVTGVVEDIPGNSSISFDFLAPFEKLPATFAWVQNRVDNWRVSSFITYIQLAEQATAQAVEAKLPAFWDAHYPGLVDRMREKGDWDAESAPYGYRLQPLTQIHLDTSVQAGLSAPNDPRYAYILGAIALGILLIACINFTTLAIGRSASRAREIGIRKIVGAHRRQLMVQFWGEAMLMSILALSIGIALAELFLPAFNTLATKSLHFEYGDSGITLSVLGGITLLTGLIAGGYPALILSGFKPLDTLSKRLKLGGSNLLTRSLVVVQFGLSVFLIVSTLVMLHQLDFTQTMNLGFNKEQVVVIPMQGLNGEDTLQRFRTELGGHTDVVGLTGASSSFTRGYSYEGFDYKGEEKAAFVYRVESNYLDVLEIDLVAGRTFDPNLSTDSTKAVLVNEALVRDFGWTDPVGQVLEGFYESPTVIGVVKDFNFWSLQETVAPMTLVLDPSWPTRYILARVAPGDISASLDALQATWQTIAPDVPFQYSFLDEDLDRQYQSEERWSQIVGYAAMFAILIACLGLFGLAALSTTGRTKEVGIRKALGASVPHVTFLLSKDLTRLVLVAILLALPAAFFVMQTWLEGFAYRIEMGPGVFLLAGTLVLGVALLTVSFQAIKAALSDPVKSLRYE